MYTPIEPDNDDTVEMENILVTTDSLEKFAKLKQLTIVNKVTRLELRDHDDNEIAILVLTKQHRSQYTHRMMIPKRYLTDSDVESMVKWGMYILPD